MSRKPSPIPLEPARGRGRPTKYTDAIAQTIIDGLSRGTPLTVICAEIKVDDSTVRDWQDAREDFSRAIAQARVIGYDLIANRVRRTARGVTLDDGGDSTGDVNRDKLIIETDLKLLAKWDPKRYGDKQQVEHSGQIGLADMVINSMKDRAGK
jgi:hypothetical protein